MQTIEEMVQYLAQERANGATIIQPSDLTPISYYRPVIETIYLSGNDYYKAQGKCRLHYSGLTKLGNTAGVEWDPAYTCRVDDRSDKMYVIFRAVGGVRKNDGRLYPVKAEYDLNLEIIEEETRDSYISKGKGFGKTGQALDDYVNSNTKRDVIQKRKRKLTLAESGAKARVLRALLDFPSQYANENQIVGMPFIVVRFVLYHQNSDIKKLFLETARQSMLGLYGSGDAPALPVPLNDVSDAIDVTAVPTAEPESESEPKPKAEQGPGPMKSEGSDERTKAPTEREQFLLYDAQTQGAILDQLSKKVGYDIQHFCEQAKVMGPDQLSEAKRVEFYDFLTTETVAA